MFKPIRSSLVAGFFLLSINLQAAAESLSIDFYLADFSNLFSMETANYFQRLALEQQLEVRFHDAKGDAKTQLEQLQKASGNVIVLDPIKSAQAQLDIAREKKAKLIYINSQPKLADFDYYDNMWYVGSDLKQCVQTQAQNILNYISANPWYDLDGDGVFKILYLQGPEPDPKAKFMLSSLKETLTASGLEYQLLNNCSSCTWNYNSAYSYIEQLCTQDKFETFDAIVAADDDLALAAIDAFEDHKPGFIGSFNLPVFSIDGLLQTELYLKQGLLTATVNRQPRKIAELALLLSEDRIPEPTNSDYVRVDRAIFIPAQALLFSAASSEPNPPKTN